MAPKELTRSQTPVTGKNNNANVTALNSDRAATNNLAHTTSTTFDGQYVPLDEVEDEGMLVDDSLVPIVTPVNASSSSSTGTNTPVKYCTYYRAVFLTDKGTLLIAQQRGIDTT